MEKIKQSSDKLKIEGYRGTWYVINKGRILYDDVYYKDVFMLESEQWGDMVEPLIVDAHGNVIDEYDEKITACVWK